MSLVLDAFAGSWDTAGMTLCQISDYSVRQIRGLLLVVCQRQLRLYGHKSALWTRLTREFGVVDTSADGQRFGSSSHW